MKQVLLNTPLTPLLVKYCAPQILRENLFSSERKVLSTSNFEKPLIFRSKFIVHLQFLKTSLFQKGKKGKTEQPASSETANPIYMWLVHPKEETGLKEGISNYDQIR